MVDQSVAQQHQRSHCVEDNGAHASNSYSEWNIRLCPLRNNLCLRLQRPAMLATRALARPIEQKGLPATRASTGGHIVPSQMWMIEILTCITKASRCHRQRSN